MTCLKYIPIWPNLFGILWTLWISISLSRCRMFSAMIALKIPSVPFSFSSPSAISTMQIMFLLIVSYYFHRLSSFFSICFPFAPLIRLISNVLLGHWCFFCIVSSAFESIDFFSSHLYFSALGIFVYVFLVELLVLPMHCYPNSFSCLCVLVVH